MNRPSARNSQLTALPTRATCKNRSPNGAKHDTETISPSHSVTFPNQTKPTITRTREEIEAGGGRVDRRGGATTTHEELVDAEASVYGDDAAPVVLHPPLRRGPRRVPRQQLRQTLARDARAQVERDRYIESRKASEMGAANSRTLEGSTLMPMAMVTAAKKAKPSAASSLHSL